MRAKKDGQTVLFFTPTYLGKPGNIITFQKTLVCNSVPNF